MQKQKGISTLVGIIIVVAVAVVAFGGVFAYQNSCQIFGLKYGGSCGTPPPTISENTETAGSPVQSQQATEGWKTYINEQYGYGISIPKDWSWEGSNVLPDKNAYHIGFFATNIQASGWVDTVKDSSNCYSLSSCIKSHPVQFTADNEKGNNLTNVMINGKQAMTESLIFNNTEFKAYYFYQSGNLYTIEFTTNDVTDKDTTVIIFNQILSTFKFTTPTNQTAGWKTYTNSQYGYEFQYPSSWTVQNSLQNDTNYNGNILIPPAGEYTDIYISIANCQTITQQHPGKVQYCKQENNLAIYFYAFSDGGVPMMGGIMDSIVSGIKFIK